MKFFGFKTIKPLTGNFNLKQRKESEIVMQFGLNL